MADILSSTPQDRRNMDRQARALNRKCERCESNVHVSNLTALKDGRKVCTDCVNALLDEAFDA